SSWPRRYGPTTPSSRSSRRPSTRWPPRWRPASSCPRVVPRRTDDVNDVSGPRRRRGRVTATPAATGNGHTEDQHLLQRGPLPPPRDDSWRSLRILPEFVEGFDALANIPKAISVFGSARTARDDPMYEAARQVGDAIARAGFA